MPGKEANRMNGIEAMSAVIDRPRRLAIRSERQELRRAAGCGCETPASGSTRRFRAGLWHIATAGAAKDQRRKHHSGPGRDDALPLTSPRKTRIYHDSIFQV